MSDLDPYTGEIRLFAGTVVPQGWARCEGQTLDRHEHELLFDIIKNIYGGDGVSTFCLPDLRGRAPLHQGKGEGQNLSLRVVGQRGGVEQVALVAGQLPRHWHRVLVSKLTANSASPVSDGVLAEAPSPFRAYVPPPGVPDINEPLAAGTVQNSGAAPVAGHENRMPSLALHFLICLQGTHPF